MFGWWRKKSLPQARLWALAAGGILTKINSEPFEQLSCTSGPANSRAYLRDGWGVNNPQELTRILEWLWAKGHSKNCLELCQSLDDPTDDWLDHVVPDAAGLRDFLTTNLEELRASRLVGWDLSRLVQVARWGHTAAFIQEDMAWSWIMRAARRLQGSFRSWRALGRDFVLGYEFWWRSISGTCELQLAPVQKWLVSNAESPWRKLAWDTPLSG